MGPFPVVKNKRFIVTFQDAFSGFNIMVASPDHTTNTVVQLLVERVVTYYRTPVHVFGDRGREFVGHIWDQLETILGCTMVRTSPYHPQGNGQVECSHRTINNAIRAEIAQKGTNRWPEHLPAIQRSMNAAPREDCQLSPHQIIMDTVPHLPADLHLPCKRL